MIQQRNDLLEQLKKKYADNGGEMREINLFGIANDADQNKDVFNDYLGLNIGNDIWIWKGTTNPGRNATIKKEGGAAHLVEGYQPEIWCLEIHAKSNPSFAHLALCSRPEYGCKPTKIWRDVDRNYIRTEKDLVQSGFFGINFHRASKAQDIPIIGEYSYGCQVTQHAKDFEDILSIIQSTTWVKDNPKYLFGYLLTNITGWVI